MTVEQPIKSPATVCDHQPPAFPSADLSPTINVEEALHAQSLSHAAAVEVQPHPPTTQPLTILCRRSHPSRPPSSKSFCWRVGVLACWRVGVLKFQRWQVSVLAYWRVGMLACWRVGVLACCRVGEFACWRVGVLACWRVGVSAYWSVGVLVCWRIGVLCGGGWVVWTNSIKL